MKLDAQKITALSFALILLLVSGCGPKNQDAKKPNVDQGLDQMIEELQASKAPYKGNLNPEKAAEITNAVAKLSLSEIPTKDLSKDPKAMMEINERIRKKSDALYAQYGTSMGEVMRYISDLSPKDREIYNKKLTELFLADARQKTDRPSAPKAETPAPKK
jgi:hypothetical protein